MRGWKLSLVKNIAFTNLTRPLGFKLNDFRWLLLLDFKRLSIHRFFLLRHVHLALNLRWFVSCSLKLSCGECLTFLNLQLILCCDNFYVADFHVVWFVRLKVCAWLVPIMERFGHRVPYWKGWLLIWVLISIFDWQFWSIDGLTDVPMSKCHLRFSNNPRARGYFRGEQASLLSFFTWAILFINAFKIIAFPCRYLWGLSRFSISVSKYRLLIRLTLLPSFNCADLLAKLRSSVF